ncbi:MAG: Gx transporter family protein [Candidatus Fermentibacteraceae bacterium]
MSDRGGIPLTAALIMLAVSLGVVDAMIPRPVPFMKLGLANLPAVICSVRLGFRRTMALNTTRALAVALLTGSLATPTFLLSLAGAVASALVMSAVSRGYPWFLSLTGVSICGACASVWSQLWVASLVLPGLPLQALVMPVTLWGVASGTVVGLAAGLVDGHLARHGVLSR